MDGAELYHESLAILEDLYNATLTNAQKMALYEQYLYKLRKAAYRGYGMAQFDLGQHYEDMNYFGKNPDFDPRKCFYWYEKACDNKVGAACNNLASYYEQGLACVMDKKKALNLYKQSADLGDPLGKRNYKLLKKELGNTSDE